MLSNGRHWKLWRGQLIQHALKMTHRDFLGGSSPTPVSKYTINELFCLTDYFALSLWLHLWDLFSFSSLGHDVKSVLLAQNRILLILIYA